MKVLPGDQKASVAYKQQKAEVEYDSGKITMDQIQKAVQDAGYRSQQIQTGEHTS